ncbi:MAG: hypothetical protein CTR55_25105 [Pseudomonas sp.]|uniref:hypothetical protein n=1 Tax=Pseudomonas sp. TaxID=306 RepID=UPI000CCADD3D|nr:hypothetical protein [Pseudomonas sp.]PJI46320.1 MAG: hypothetical protein CTR55_25105 [Pseudomonas sp.]
MYLLFSQFDWELNKGFKGLGYIFWGVAMIADLASLYKAISETTFGKLLLIAALAFGTNLAVAIASQVVNGLVGVDPGKFVHTIAFATVFVAPPLLLFMYVFLLALGTGGLALYVMFNFLPDENSRVMMFPWYKPRERGRYRALTALVQVISAVVVVTVCYQWWTGGQSAYVSYAEEKTKWFLYTFEMFGKAPCVLEKGQRVAFLDGDRVLMASKAGEAITFKVTQCVIPVDGM